jgi:Ca-activated chloride channel homolog
MIMEFLWPAMLLSLVLAPIFLLLYLNLQRKRKRKAEIFSGLGFVDSATRKTGDRQHHIPAALFLTGLIIVLIALARPHAVVSMPRLERTIILAFDVSGSMAAADIEPTRMEASKTASQAFLGSLPAGAQVGVVVFSDSGFTVQTPTDDTDVLLTTIERLSPQRGTSLANGIYASLTTITGGFEQDDRSQGTFSNGLPGRDSMPALAGKRGSAVIVLLSDGENNMTPDPFDAAQLAADHGIPIYTIGVGSPAGSTITIDGFNIHTQLDEAALKEISRLTGGIYYNAESDEQLLEIYESLAPQLVMRSEKIEVTSLFAGAGIVVLLIGATFSLVWFSRLP